ncbi:MAG: transposase [Xenococcaceae cyanobacterium MO_167.B27]|nr:transposase [Xenococcaceae cyanobacterium MO_167.B27]
MPIAFSEFLKILEYVADKKEKVVSYIDQWYPSTKTCSVCNYVLDELPLDVRYWTCPSCSTKHGRDSNSSVNILRVGASTLGLGDVRLSRTAISA